jgi:hypothetical protein
MNLGIIGLAITYLLISVPLLIICVKSNISGLYKFLLIPIVLWYSMVLYSVPGNFMGWPKYQEPPDKAIVLSSWIEEPKQNDKGGIYLWALNFPKVTKKEITFNPQAFIDQVKKEIPRAYKIPYSKEMHEKLLAAQKKQKEEQSLMQWHRGKSKFGERGKTGKKKEGEDESGFTLVKPQELLPKIEQ